MFREQMNNYHIVVTLIVPEIQVAGNLMIPFNIVCDPFLNSDLHGKWKSDYTNKCCVDMSKYMYFQESSCFQLECFYQNNENCCASRS